MYDIMVNQQGVSEAEMLAILAQKSRDNSRTPMQWNDQEHAGFTQGQPWLEVAANYPEINAEKAVADDDSVFHYYRKLIKLRKELAVITTGDYTDLMPDHPQLFCYRRQSDKQTLVCINNYYGQEAECQLPETLNVKQGRYILGNYSDSQQQVPTHHLVLKPKRRISGR